MQDDASEKLEVYFVSDPQKKITTRDGRTLWGCTPALTAFVDEVRARVQTKDTT